MHSFFCICVLIITLHTRTCTRMHTHTHTHARKCTRKRTRMYTHLHTHTHKTHTNTHTRTRSSKQSSQRHAQMCRHRDAQTHRHIRHTRARVITWLAGTWVCVCVGERLVGCVYMCVCVYVCVKRERWNLYTHWQIPNLGKFVGSISQHIHRVLFALLCRRRVHHNLFAPYTYIHCDMLTSSIADCRILLRCLPPAHIAHHKWEIERIPLPSQCSNGPTVTT